MDARGLIQRLGEVARRMFLALNGIGLGRCDLRMGAERNLILPEINPKNGNPYRPADLGPADIMMEYHPEGQDGFLDRFFRAAIMRQSMRRTR